MGELEIDAIRDMLVKSNVYTTLFDATRIVDAQAGKVIDVHGDALRETAVNCVDIFGCEERCKNCTSIRALYQNEQVVKLEYVGGTVLLIVSAPITVDGRHLVVEMVKDITSSMTVDLKDDYRADEVSVIIDRFNRIATTDSLTHLMNRRFIDEKLPNILENSRHMGRPTSVAMIDIDHFKAVNDRFGHRAGDLVLAGLGAALEAFVRRESDFAARFGGEEFLLCFPGTSLAACRDICERIRKKVEQSPFSFEGNSIHITVSIGAAETGEFENPTLDDMVALADRRMYTAKQNGRNRVV